MEQSKLMERLEGYRRRNDADHCYVNGDLYRLFYNRDLYIIAYNSVKSNDGAETSGADGTSLHGFCEEWITELIASMRDESYQPQPNRTTMIPKSNGKMRKLSFPNGKDKLVQEAIRIILECIYEPTFSNLSHGFRPKRSTQSAIAEVETWRGTIWFIEGDISACFDEIDHRTLENVSATNVSSGLSIRHLRPATSTCSTSTRKLKPETHRAPAAAPYSATSISISWTDLWKASSRETPQVTTAGKTLTTPRQDTFTKRQSKTAATQKPLSTLRAKWKTSRLLTDTTPISAE